MTAFQLLRNLAIASGTVLQHLGDDPVVLAVQLSRRLPARLVQPAAAAAARAPGPRAAAVSALGSYLAGDLPAARVRLESAAGAGRPGRHTVRLADVALAAGLTETADALLAECPPGTPGLAAAQARRRWYDGGMSAAVRELTAVRGRDARLRRRLESELRVFSGWNPRLAPVSGYEPAQRTVLHLLTNSLPYTASGYAQRSHSILKAQQEQGWSVHAATRLGYPVQVGGLAAAGTDVVDGVRYHRLLPGRLRTGFDARLQQQAEELLALALQLRPAVLHTTSHFVNGLVVHEVARVLGIPWVYEVRGQLADTWASARPVQARSSERYRLFQDREADVMKSADLVLTLGGAMKEEIVRKGVAVEKVLISPNAVGDAFLSEPGKPEEARRKLRLPADGPFIGTVSSLVDYEGLDLLLQAFARLAPSYPTLTCLIVGDGAAAPALHKLAADLGIAGRTLFPGRVPRQEAALYHQALDVFVVPRRNLAVTRAVTPLKPVEALASARPVVATRLPALAELVQEHVTGLLVEPGSVEALAAAIGALLDDAGLRSRLGTAGRLQVLAERTWTGNAGRVLALYDELLEAA